MLCDGTNKPSKRSRAYFSSAEMSGSATEMFFCGILALGHSGRASAWQTLGFNVVPLVLLLPNKLVESNRKNKIKQESSWKNNNGHKLDVIPQQYKPTLLTPTH